MDADLTGRLPESSNGANTTANDKKRNLLCSLMSRCSGCGQQLRNSEDSLMDGGPISSSPRSVKNKHGYGIRALPKGHVQLQNSSPSGAPASQEQPIGNDLVFIPGHVVSLSTNQQKLPTGSWLITLQTEGTVTVTIWPISNDGTLLGLTGCSRRGLVPGCFLFVELEILGLNHSEPSFDKSFANFIQKLH
ncbi:hypothetical protein P7K49_036353 [Saguinus oedipus]|uniref:Uncharacterized protein n=1 Tax=Saguinus oedipus TaxID=9490 RepID=A0ABQ9TJV5_SAGOE|nr:hypothetical protein P7K49_036353 [Saguinus oedipus]